MLTVAELIAKLQKLPPDAVPVHSTGRDGDTEPVAGAYLAEGVVLSTAVHQIPSLKDKVVVYIE